MLLTLCANVEHCVGGNLAHLGRIEAEADEVKSGVKELRVLVDPFAQFSDELDSRAADSNVNLFGQVEDRVDHLNNRLLLVR